MIHKILICDDSMFMRTMLKKILASYGFETVEAQNGREAVELYREHLPDLVTMDITMPEMNGIEAVQVIMEEYPEARVIMVSAMGQKSLVKDAIKAGAVDFVIKPFNEEQVIQAINKLGSI